MLGMLVESQLQDVLFIHGSDQDHCMLHLLNSDKTGFDVEKEIDLHQFNIVQLGILLA